MYASSTRREEGPAEPIASVAVEQTAGGPVVSAMDELGNAIHISSHASGAPERAHRGGAGQVRITMTGPRGAGSFLMLSREAAEELVEQLDEMLRELRRSR